VFGDVVEVDICSKQGQLAADAQLGKQSVDRTGLNAARAR